MPRMTHLAEIARRLGSSLKLITKLDHESAYRQLRITKEDQLRALGLHLDDQQLPKIVKPLNNILGLEVHLEHGGLLPARREKLLADLLLAQHQHLSITSKFAGRLSFACDSLFGRVGRAYVRTIIRYSRGLPIDSALLNTSLRTLYSLFNTASRPRDLVYELSIAPHPVLAFADATGSGGLGVVLFDKSQDSLAFGFTKFPKAKSPHINSLELLAADLALSSAARWRLGSDIILFTNNTVASVVVLSTLPLKLSFVVGQAILSP
ncbi:hypothetical protein Pmar_PMAR001633 [Perkinsus marinus ATCC 50983]|uniref:Uncharacterized protein n=1 Tax=Perkinsus marinus (strain ATCC 50983 / TXsc) TaxID=423536 RepID=C5K683_PERM5|nr:hypothetical protein Pmar_PMAR001633 [Perkinsus marinus ATCC 50983]EER20011.1 hypothetical protein Pmar_PMAR001633 [Perkinsus marinus ATCC 50983]|eukprot:XP_002788215.1 hypothetical protein Pmar_PMAR001633 [Perkinsus marinus ATCC 50983]